QGCFDITMGPLVSLWSADPDTTRPPDISQIRQTLHLVNYRDLILDPYQRTAGLRKAGQSIDLGGIGKGFTGDKILVTYREFGISSAYSNLGGNVVTLGAKPDGSPWQIGIQHPRQENRIIGAVSVVNQSVVTSGDYQRYITDNDGNRYHHILDPSTGYPSESGLISVTVVADNSMTADALSTILFIAGMKKGLEILRNYPQTEVILVDTNMQIFVTKGLKDHFQADDNIQVNILEQ
ncbi:MAG: FAD:protein FMN transferase, partial [Smithella sp.]